MEDEDEMYIEHTYYTDRGRRRTVELRLGDISYFEYEYCKSEPDYPYVNDISEDEFYGKIKSIKEFITKLDDISKGGENESSK